MVCVNPGNDAFAAVVSRASKALGSKVEARYAAGVNWNDKKLFITLASVGEACANHIEQRQVASVQEVASALKDFAVRCEVSKIDLVFLNVPNDGQYRRKWVLIDPRTLEPRRVNNVAIEAAFNPI